MDFFKRKKNKIPFGRPLVTVEEIKSITKYKSGIYAHGPISSLFEKICKFTQAIFYNCIFLHSRMHLFLFFDGYWKRR